MDRLLHDLKQPLSLIRLVAQDLRLDVREDRFDVDSLPESMRTVEATVDELATRIDQLRGFVKTSNALPRETSSDVDAVVRTVVARAREEWSEDLQIIEALAPGLPAVAIGPLALEMVIWELVENAVQAAGSPGGACEVRVSTERQGSAVVVSVRDAGGGVPDEVSASIFEPFFTTREDASGLGLAIARELVHRAGGELALADSGGRGALFELRLEGRG